MFCDADIPSLNHDAKVVIFSPASLNNDAKVMQAENVACKLVMWVNMNMCICKVDESSRQPTASQKTEALERAMRNVMAVSERMLGEV